MSRCQSLGLRPFGRSRSVIHTGVLLGLFAAVLAGCGSEPSPAPREEALPAPGKIVYTSRPDPTDPTQLNVMEADGSRQRLLLAPPEGVDRPSWSPDGSKVAYEKAGECNPFGEDPSEQCTQICVVSVDGTGNHCLTSAQVSSMGPEWSPNGDLIAFERSDVFVMQADGTDEQRLTAAGDSVEAGDLAWSPDGSKIVFSSPSDVQDSDLYVVRADGSDMHRLTDSDDMDWAPDWSPDGKRIAFTRGFALWVMNADGSDQHPLSRSRPEGLQPGWAPDGTQIVFVCSIASRELCLINTDGSGRHTATHGAEAEAPDWAPATEP